jgi:hypothetical protein
MPFVPIALPKGLIAFLLLIQFMLCATCHADNNRLNSVELAVEYCEASIPLRQSISGN